MTNKDRIDWAIDRLEPVFELNNESLQLAEARLTFHDDEGTTASIVLFTNTEGRLCVMATPGV